MTLSTPRLVLRPWRASDREPFARLNADGEVMRHFPSTLRRQESDALYDRIQEHVERHGFGLWAVEIRGATEFAGFVGLAVPSFEAPFTPAVEIGWRFGREHWGQGYATEGARAVVEYAFNVLRLEEVVSFTVPANVRSIAVMQRLGMQYTGEFPHPNLPSESPLSRHIYYRLGNPRVGSGAFST